MSEKGSRNEGIRVIAAFDDRAVPLSAEAGVTSDRPVRSANEGVRMVAAFDGPVIPLTDDDDGSPPAAPAGPRPRGLSGWVGRLASRRTIYWGTAAAILIVVCVLIALADVRRWFSSDPGTVVTPERTPDRGTMHKASGPANDPPDPE